MIEIIIYIVGIFLVLFVFVHSWYFSLKGKMTRKCYKLARRSVGFLVAGLVAFWVLVQADFMQELLLKIPQHKYVILLWLSGLWLLIGLVDAILYYWTIYIREK